MNSVIGATYVVSTYWAFAEGFEETFISLAYSYVFVTIIANALFIAFFNSSKK